MPEMIATRFGYSDGLLELGASNPRVVVLDADLSRSTTTEKFQKKYPDRFFQISLLVIVLLLPHPVRYQEPLAAAIVP